MGLWVGEGGKAYCVNFHVVGLPSAASTMDPASGICNPYDLDLAIATHRVRETGQRARRRADLDAEGAQPGRWAQARAARSWCNGGF